MEGDTKVAIISKQQQEQGFVERKEKVFASRLLDNMAHFIAVGLVLFIIWHAVPGSSKINRQHDCIKTCTVIDF